MNFAFLVSLGAVFCLIVSVSSGVPLATSYSYRVDGQSGYSYGYGYNRVARSNYDSSPSTNSYSSYVVHGRYPNYDKRYSAVHDVPTYYRKYFNGAKDLPGPDYGMNFDEKFPEFWKSYNDRDDDYFNSNDYYEDGYDQRDLFGFPKYVGFDGGYNYDEDDYYRYR